MPEDLQLSALQAECEHADRIADFCPVAPAMLRYRDAVLDLLAAVEPEPSEDLW